MTPQPLLFDYGQLDAETRITLKQRADRINERARRMAQDIWENGREFYEAQQELAKYGYGCFREWAKAETGYSHQTVYNFIRVYQIFDCKKFLQSNIATSALYMLAAPSTPDEARQEAIERARAGETITHQSAKEIINGYKSPRDDIKQCDLCSNLYDAGKFQNCPYCYKKQHGLREGYIDGLVEMVNKDIDLTGNPKPAPPIYEPRSPLPFVAQNNGDNDCDNPERDYLEPSPIIPFNYKRDTKSTRSVDIYTPQGYDACQTPGYAIDPLLPYLADSWTIWEPAVGERLLEEALFDSGFKHVIGTDILSGQNFFEFEPDSWNCLITNPPYSIKYKWLERCYELGKPFALLMPIEILGTESAGGLFEQFGIEIIFVRPRINFKMPNKGWNGGGAQFPVAWFTWHLNIGRQITFAKVIADDKAN